MVCWPKGVEALHWHQLFNEIQMLLFSHPVNEAREVRGELPVNSVWLWAEVVPRLRRYREITRA